MSSYGRSRSQIRLLVNAQQDFLKHDLMYRYILQTETTFAETVLLPNNIIVTQLFLRNCNCQWHRGEGI